MPEKYFWKRANYVTDANFLLDNRIFFYYIATEMKQKSINKLNQGE